MKEKLKYFFELNLFFDKQVDIFAIAKKFKLDPDEIITNEEANDPNKTAKLFYQTYSYDDFYLGDTFKEFISSLKEDFPNLKQILQENNGEGWVCIVFSKFSEFCLFFEKQTIEDLSDLGLQLDVGYTYM